MNMKFVKRFLAVSMAATIMVVPMVASAATKTAQQTKTAEQTTEQTTQSTQTEQESAGEKHNKTMAEKTAASTTAVVAGKTLKSDVAGTVDVTNSKTYKAFILTSTNGKTAGDKQTVFSKTAKESPKAFDSANAAAAAIGGTVVGDAINADITLKNGGTAKAVLKEAPTGTVKVIQVADGGATTVLDATVDGTVVSFTPSNGHFTYFIVVI